MSKQVISTSMAPEVIIEQVAGDLQIKGWDEPEIKINADPEDLTVEEQDDAVRISCQGDCFIRLPRGAAVKLGSSHGEVQIKYLDESLTLGEVHGNLTLRGVAAAQVEAVHGDLSAKDLSGDLRVKQVQGNVAARDVQGKCSLEEVGGNLDLRDVESDIHVNASGNARIRLSSMTGSDYHIQAEGHVHCHIPEDVSFKVDLSSQGDLIRVKLPDKSQDFHQAHAELVLGAGEGVLTIASGDTLYLFSQGATWADQEADFGEDFRGLPDDFGQRIAQQVESQIHAQMDTMTQHMNAQMARMAEQFGKSGFSPEVTERIIEQSRRVSEREAARAEEKMRRAQEKLERKLESTRRRQDAKSHGRPRHTWTFEWPSSPKSSAPPAPPAVEEAVSEEERLMILRMLEEKKISLEEADQLLAALEGQ